MSFTKRLIIASLISPLVVFPAFVFPGVFFELLYSLERENIFTLLRGFFMVSSLMVIVTYFFTLVIGVPITLILFNANKFNLININMTGWLLASFISLLFDTWFVPFFICCYLSSAVTSSFWFILSYKSRK